MATRNGNAPRGSASFSPVAESSPHRGRSLNIAHLPNDIHEQLNLRLLEGGTGKELAAWLNALPSPGLSPKVLPGPITSLSIPLNLSHTPFNPDRDLSEILKAV